MIIEQNLASSEHVKNFMLDQVIDLHIFFQRADRRLTEEAKKVLPLLEERLKNIPTGYLEHYIRRVINIEDIIPS